MNPISATREHKENKRLERKLEKYAKTIDKLTVEGLCSGKAKELGLINSCACTLCEKL